MENRNVNQPLTIGYQCDTLAHAARFAQALCTQRALIGIQRKRNYYMVRVLATDTYMADKLYVESEEM